MILLQVAGNGAVVANRLGGGGVDIPVARIFASLVACLLIAVFAILFLRQRGGKSDLRASLGRLAARHGEIEIVEVRRVSLNGDICLVRHDGCEYLILVQVGTSTLLRERPVPARDGAA